jgi:hypothetical protein
VGALSVVLIVLGVVAALGAAGYAAYQLRIRSIMQQEVGEGPGMPHARVWVGCLGGGWTGVQVCWYICALPSASLDRPAVAHVARHHIQTITSP